MIKQLKELSSVSTEYLKFDREEWGKKLGPIWNLWKTLFKPSERIRGVPK